MKETAGAQCLKASSDRSIYDPLELGYAISDDIPAQLFECAFRHESIFDEPEFFVILLVGSDPVLHNIRRHKYYAYPAMPSPRPQQSVYLYDKHKQTLKRMWSLPSAKVMAILSEMVFVAPQWQETQGWCHAFFSGKFHELIREQHHISHLSETEYLDANREKFIKAGAKDLPIFPLDSIDSSQVFTDKVIDSQETLKNQGYFASTRETEGLNRDIRTHVG